MNESNKPGPLEPAIAGSSSAATRKPYLKPAFRHEPVFETMALACGKISDTQRQCNSNRKNS